MKDLIHPALFVNACQAPRAPQNALRISNYLWNHKLELTAQSKTAKIPPVLLN